MKDFNTYAESVSATDQRIAQYDLSNGTELLRFVRILRIIQQEDSIPTEYYHIGNTGDLLNSLGIVGQITVSKYAINERRHSRSGHSLSVENWIDALDSINDPIAVCLYCRAKRGYRIYVDKEENGKVICLGIDVNSVGRNVYVSNISTAFWRDIDKMGRGTNEVLIYKKKTAMRKSSSGHNSQIYSCSQNSNDKSKDNSE